MSAPIDTPNNLNIMVQHTEKVVEPAKPQMSQNSTFRSSLGLENRKTRESEKERKGAKKKKDQRKDRFEKRAETKDTGEMDDNNTEIQSGEMEDAPEAPVVGGRIDIIA